MLLEFVCTPINLKLKQNTNPERGDVKSNEAFCQKVVMKVVIVGTSECGRPRAKLARPASVYWAESERAAGRWLRPPPPRCPTLFCLQISPSLFVITAKLFNLFYMTKLSRCHREITIPISNSTCSGSKIDFGEHWSTNIVWKKKQFCASLLKARTLINIGALANCWCRNLPKT